jgi:hypothetical protein
VGTDAAATEFLSELDDDPEVGNRIDCVSDYEVEAAQVAGRGSRLTPESYLLKLMLGGIDAKYDRLD